MPLDLDNEHDLVSLHSALRMMHFDCSCTAKGLLNQQGEARSASVSKVSAKLPKLEIPTFTGEILRPAAQVIKGLSHTGDQYEEAVACLKSWYNQPRAVHEAYVKVIVEYPRMKDSSKKRTLQDARLNAPEPKNPRHYGLPPRLPIHHFSYPTNSK